MYFELMHSRLVGNLREKIRSGEISERALAKQAGVSQPHLHNVLKGLRIFSAPLADQVVIRLRLQPRDLLREDELGLERRGRRTAVACYAEIPLLEGRIGPEDPFPHLDRQASSIPFLASDVAGASGAVAVRLGADREVGHLFGEGDIALLAPLPSRQKQAQAEGYFAIDRGGCGQIRRVERQGEVFRVVGGDESDKQPCIRPADRNILEVVRAKVIWIGRYLERSPIAARPVEEAGEEHRRAGRKR